MTVSIYDIAKEAGVNPFSVSRALENHPHIGAATRKRIQELVKAMEYVPNTVVNGLITSRISDQYALFFERSKMPTNIIGSAANNRPLHARQKCDDSQLKANLFFYLIAQPIAQFNSSYQRPHSLFCNKITSYSSEKGGRIK